MNKTLVWTFVFVLLSSFAYALDINTPYNYYGMDTAEIGVNYSDSRNEINLTATMGGHTTGFNDGAFRCDNIGETSDNSYLNQNANIVIAQFPSGTFYIDIWLYYNSSPTVGVSKYSRAFEYYVDNSNLFFYGFSPSCATGMCLYTWDDGSATNSYTHDLGITFNAGQWYHVAWQFDGAFISGWVNGNLELNDSDVTSLDDFGAGKFWFNANPENTDTAGTNITYDEIMIVNGTCPGCAVDRWNSGAGLFYDFLPPVDTTPPTITINYPSNGSRYNDYNGWINVSLNENGSVYLNDSRWLLNSNNITHYYFYNSDYGDLADGIYTINITANDTSQNNATQLLYFTIDTTAPIARSNLENNDTFVNLNLTYYINVTDSLSLIWAINHSIDGTLINETVNLTTSHYIYNGTYNTTLLSVGKHNFSTIVCDAHTDNKIKDFNVTKEEDKVSFDNTWIKSKTKTKDINYKKLEDRYTFTFEYDKPIKQIQVEVPESCVYINNPMYKGWFVCPEENKWIDFEGSYDVSVKGHTVTITSMNPTLKFEFSSVGSLNCQSYMWHFYKFNESTSYKTDVMEATTQTYKLILDYVYGGDIYATFYFNNTVYSNTKTSSSTQTNFTSTIAIPLDWINATNLNITKDMYWNYTINRTLFNTSRTNQTIYKFIVNNCTEYTSTYALNITFINNTNGLATNVTFEAVFDYWYLDILQSKNFTIDVTNVDYHSVCIYPSWANFLTTASMIYTAGDTYNYNIWNYGLTNVTKELVLYTTDGTTAVTFTVTDQDDTELEDVLIYIMAFDTGTNSYNTVEILSTDYQGIALGNIISDTQPYKFILYYRGALVFESSNTFITSTAKTFRINLQEDYYDNLDIAIGISSSLTFTNATRSFVYTFSDGTGTIHQGCLKVVKRSINGDTLLNDTCVASAASSIIVDIGDNVGSNIYMATGYVIFDDEIITDTLTITESETWKTYGTEGLFMSFLITTALVTIGIFSPIIAIVLLIISFVITNIIGLFHLNWMWLVGFIILGCIAIFRMSRSGVR